MYAPRRILFVCLGNTCRSPMAESFLRHILQQTGKAGEFSIASAGTRVQRIGGPADDRARTAARRRGFDIPEHQSREVKKADFDAFDLILAMDRASQEDLVRMAPVSGQQKIRLLLEYAPATGLTEIPDPWHGNVRDYERALNLISIASEGLVATLSQTPSSSAS